MKKVPLIGAYGISNQEFLLKKKEKNGFNEMGGLLSYTLCCAIGDLLLVQSLRLPLVCHTRLLGKTIDRKLTKHLTARFKKNNNFANRLSSMESALL